MIMQEYYSLATAIQNATDHANNATTDPPTNDDAETILALRLEIAALKADNRELTGALYRSLQRQGSRSGATKQKQKQKQKQKK